MVAATGGRGCPEMVVFIHLDFTATLGREQWRSKQGKIHELGSESQLPELAGDVVARDGDQGLSSAVPFLVHSGISVYLHVPGSEHRFKVVEAGGGGGRTCVGLGFLVLGGCRTRSSSQDQTSEPLVSGYVPETGCLSIIVLGASGDLAKKKTFPDLFHLYHQELIQSHDVHIFGYTRTKISDNDFERSHSSVRLSSMCSFLLDLGGIKKESEL
ncbi:hypothetical protein LXL04_020088 [Taraxacum kok-saghyz]